MPTVNNRGPFVLGLGLRLDVLSLNAADRPQEWRDRLRWVKLLRDKQPVSLVHLIVNQAIDMEPDRRAVQLVSEFERPPWAQRKFSFGHPPWMLADFIERLRGVLPRLDALLVGLDDDRAHRQLEGKWSIAQNIGHLSDVEELWQERLEDLRGGRKTYSPAVGARFQELAKRHQDRPVLETMKELRTRRSRLIDALAQASPKLQHAAAFHERLQVPMRLVDCAQFYAEHDDHHLIRIRRLRSMLGLDAG